MIFRRGHLTRGLRFSVATLAGALGLYMAVPSQAASVGGIEVPAPYGAEVFDHPEKLPFSSSETTKQVGTWMPTDLIADFEADQSPEHLRFYTAGLLRKKVEHADFTDLTTAIQEQRWSDVLGSEKRIETRRHLRTRRVVGSSANDDQQALEGDAATVLVSITRCRQVNVFERNGEGHCGYRDKRTEGYRRVTFIRIDDRLLVLIAQDLYNEIDEWFWESESEALERADEESMKWVMKNSYSWARKIREANNDS